MVSKPKIIEEHGPLCYICGIETTWYTHYQEDNEEAQKSPRPDDSLTIDHVVPISKGGTNDPANLRICCTKCNNLKGSTDILELLCKRWSYGILLNEVL